MTCPAPGCRMVRRPVRWAHDPRRVPRSPQNTRRSRPALMPSREAAEEYIRLVEKYLTSAGDLKIQTRTVTDWEDV